MTKSLNKYDATKGKALVIFEYILLALCLAVVALRATYAESPTMQSAGVGANLNDIIYSLSVSAVLIFSFILWFVWSLCTNRFLYRHTGIEIGLCIFLAAAVIAGLVAPNKRLAINSFAVILAPMLMALLLVQILDSTTKVRLVLAVVAALGVVNAQRSAEQVLSSNRATIAEYEKDPRSQLELRGIEPNTLNAFLFEHRVYSAGVSGFFITRNSAASFLLLASFAAAALFIDQLRNRKADYSPLHVLACGIVLAVVLLNLVLTRSKGAFVGSFFAVALFIIYLRFGVWLKAHRRALLIGCLLLAVLGTVAVVSYGSTHGRLPGGNSMLVRWQYWRAAAEMYADHPITGVGPGAFFDYYTHYKPDAALEWVSDPHNFPLSILTQYGPLGLIGFLAMILLPLWRVLSPSSAEAKVPIPGPAFHKLAIPFAIVLSAAMLIVRPIVFPLPPTISPEERQAGILLLYVMPVLVFLVGLLLVAVGQKPRKNPRPSVIVAALLGAAVGLLIHNLIDFAIFEPGVFTTFWTIMACLVASHRNQKSELRAACQKPAPILRLILFAAAFTAIAGYLNYVLIPVAGTTAKTHRADRAASLDQFDQLHQLLDSAAEQDRFSPAALALNGRVYLHRFEVSEFRNRDLLLKAEESLLAAIDRNVADYKNFQRLAKVYVLLAETAPPKDTTPWLDKAFDAASQAIHRYPGRARLRVELARIAEQQGKTKIAIEQYKKAIDIEDSYHRQFRTMYPERKEVVSRIDEDKYLFAKDRLKSLTEQESP